MHSSQQSQKPNYRRRGNGRNNAAKNYASENDVAHLKNQKPATGCPVTPQKPSTAKGSNSTNQKNQNRGGRNRNKHGSTPPASHQKTQTRHTPPFPAHDGPVFAGGTFHASPAPSALPMPSFLSASTGDSPLFKSRTINPTTEPSPPSTDSDEASDPRLSFPATKEDSPLDIFFKADRAEKAKGQRANSTGAADTTPAFFSPPQGPPREPMTMPRAAAPLGQSHRPNLAKRNTSSSKLAYELEGEYAGEGYGPAFSRPYQERIKAARSTNGPAQPSPFAIQSSEEDKSDTLKRLLGVSNTQQHDSKHYWYRHSEPTQAPMHSPPQYGYMFARGHNVDGPPAQVTQHSDVAGMEDSLKRILKMT